MYMYCGDVKAVITPFFPLSLTPETSIIISNQNTSVMLTTIDVSGVRKGGNLNLLALP